MKKHESGQSLVVIALMFLGLVAVGALVVDGGSLYLNRRTAQTAADAAAMAGAHELCVGSGVSANIQAVVTKYITENGATAVDPLNPAIIDTTGDPTRGTFGSVEVHTTISTSSFLARVIGFENDTVTAVASAGCFPPSATTNLLPIAWSCQPPVGYTVGSCVTHTIPYELFEKIYSLYGAQLRQGGSLVLGEGDGVTVGSYYDPSNLNPRKMPYLVMDDNLFNIAQCRPQDGGSGTLICDFDGDGVLDLTGGGQRGWLKLDGNNGASTLSDLIVNGFPGTISIPRWFPDDSGAKSSVYGDAKYGFPHAHPPVPGIEGKVVLVPVFNSYCLNTTPSDLPGRTDCQFQTTPLDKITAGTGQANYYRVTGFAPFFVTCISSRSNEKCPAKSYAYQSYRENEYANISTIEGYFVDGWVGGDEISLGGFDLGVYVISLTK